MNIIHSNRYFLPAGILFFFLFFTAVTKGQQLTDKGRIAGVARNDRNEPLPSATIVVTPGNKTIKTNINGEFEIDLVPGTYTLVISYAGLQTKNVSDVEVKKSEVTKQDISLNVKSTGEIVITSSAKKETINAGLLIQKNNSAVSDVLSSQQMRRTPDNNLGEALKRANGVTVVDNKFVVIRGMADRYNMVMVNGSVMPSTEPNVKNFSFDIIPTAMVENIVINKTATADLPTDFAGGLVQVTTKEVPDKNTVSFSIGTNYNTVSTGNDMITTGIGKSEYFGILDKSRKWFGTAWNPNEYVKVYNTDFKKRDAMNAAIPNYWKPAVSTAMPTQDYQFTVGIRKKFKNTSSFGFLLGTTYRNTQNIEQYTYEGENGSLDSTSGQRSTFTTNISGLLTLAYNFKNNKIAFKNIYTRRLWNQALFYNGVVDQTSLVEDSYASRITTNDLLVNRLEGDHVLLDNRFKVKWFVDRISTIREFPDTRGTAYKSGSADEGYYVELTNINSVSLGGIYYNKLVEDKYGAGLDVTTSYKLFGTEQKLKAGYLGGFRNAEYRELFLRPGAQVPTSLITNQFFGKAYYDVYDPANFSSGSLYYYRIQNDAPTKAMDGYNGEQNTNAFYVLTDAKITDKFRAIIGVRAENFYISTVAPGKRVVPNPNVPGTNMTVIIDSTFVIDDFDFYPSANLVYSLSNKTNLRLSATRTSARVDFREIYPLQYYDFELLSFVRGSALQNSSIFNLDLRYEYFPNTGEVISVTGFYKKFTNPIEPFVESGTGDLIFSNVNLASSTNIGFEFDLRKSLSFISKKSKFLKNLYFSGNAAVMKSTVNIDPVDVYRQLGTDISGDTSSNYASSRNRPLSGLSPYTFNVGMLYQTEKFGANLIYNRFGRRIVTASFEPQLDRYEKPRDIIDFQLSARFFKSKMEVRFNIGNFLNQPFIIYNNAGNGDTSGDKSKANNDPKGNNYNKEYDLTIYQGNRGTTLGLSVSYRIF
jgi:hypothetical protein